MTLVLKPGTNIVYSHILKIPRNLKIKTLVTDSTFNVILDLHLISLKTMNLLQFLLMGEMTLITHRQNIQSYQDLQLYHKHTQNSYPNTHTQKTHILATLRPTAADLFNEYTVSPLTSSLSLIQTTITSRGERRSQIEKKSETSLLGEQLTQALDSEHCVNYC